MHTTLIYTDTQTTQPHSRLSLSNALSTTLLGPCHRKQHAPAGVVSQPERCSCLLPWNDLTTIQAHEYLHLRPLARNPHSQTLHDNILALPNVFPLRHTVTTNYSPATSTPLPLKHAPSSKFPQYNCFLVCNCAHRPCTDGDHRPRGKNSQSCFT